MTDKFAMHLDFPMDEAYQAKARARGFGRDKGLWHFEEWRRYWTGRPNEHKTPRGWLQCWDNNLKRIARNGADRNHNNRFERKPQNDRLPSNPAGLWIGGRRFTAFDMIALRRKQSLRQPLEPDEQQALEQWNG